MITNRRAFFGLMAGVVLAPVELIEALSPTRIFLPPACGWAVNSLGGVLYSRQLSNILRASVVPLARFREFAPGIVASRPLLWDVYSDSTA